MEMTMESHKDLVVYKISRQLNGAVYRLTAAFPASEKFALADQLRRASVSVTSNIAEGYGQGSLRGRLKFLYISRGSIYEVETQLLIAADLGFLVIEQMQDTMDLVTKIEKMLNGLIRSTEDRIRMEKGNILREPIEEYGTADPISDLDV